MTHQEIEDKTNVSWALEKLNYEPEQPATRRTNIVQKSSMLHKTRNADGARHPLHFATNFHGSSSLIVPPPAGKSHHAQPCRVSHGTSSQVHPCAFLLVL